ncbi:MAG: tRNA (adenosine(37)-N6)-dimethylallyltransferase MiaA [Erysipelotrichaceae bacterium]|nr:tRNA (adenosine(37)-N6)-dimethylallyltransferase MiaA [Erysipelotrichaceae bacterium]
MDKVIAIVGPTGVGKTKLSIELAKHLNTEIISGDSIQVYRLLNIGSAKVTKQEMEGIPHHLIDIKDLDDEYNVMEFQQMSRTIMKQLHKRGKIPVIAGGTGLYVKSTLYDYEFHEQEDDSEFMKQHEAYTNEELYEKLKEVDFDSTKTIHVNNRKRILRALFMAKCGQKKSEVINKQMHQPIYDVMIIGCTMDRQKLYERINQRVYLMMEQGLFEEVNELSKIPNIWDKQGMQGIGYREWTDYFLGNTTKEEVVQEIQKHSRQFAKRQYTWFRNQMDVQWYDMSKEGVIEQILKDVDAWREKHVE